jgi:hypothetical protein
MTTEAINAAIALLTQNDYVVMTGRERDQLYSEEELALAIEEDNGDLRAELEKIKDSRFYFPGDTEEEQGEQLYSFLTNDADTAGVWTHEEQLGEMVDEYEKKIADLQAKIDAYDRLQNEKINLDDANYEFFWAANDDDMVFWKVPTEVYALDDEEGDCRVQTAFMNERFGGDWGCLARHSIRVLDLATLEENE